MRNILFTMTLLLAFAWGANSQAYTTISDSLNGNETVNFTTMKKCKAITAECTQIGGTSDGTLTLYGSVDGTDWTFLNFSEANFGLAGPDASITGADECQITITDGLVATWYLFEDAYPFYRITGAGTANDSTLITIRYSKW